MVTESSIKITDVFNNNEFKKFVYENPNTSIFQTLEMAKVYERNIDTEPLILVAINEDTGEILASLLAKVLSHKSGCFKSFSTHSTIRGGPIFKNDAEGISATLKLLHYYDDVVKKYGLYSRIYPLNNTPQIIPSFKECGYIHQDWQNYLLRLDRPIDEIWKHLKKSRRYGINAAKKRKVTIEEINEKDLLPVFYRLLQETFRKRKNPIEDISNFEATFDILVPKNMAKFFMAKHEGRYIAALLILLYNGTAYEWYTGSSKKPTDLSLYPNDLLVWNAIEFCANNGFHTFDFGGGGLPEDANAGWIKFKKEFGGILSNYGRYTKVHQSRKLWFSIKMFEIYKKFKFL